MVRTTCTRDSGSCTGPRTAELCKGRCGTTRTARAPTARPHNTPARDPSCQTPAGPPRPPGGVAVPHPDEAAACAAKQCSAVQWSGVGGVLSRVVRRCVSVVTGMGTPPGPRPGPGTVTEFVSRGVARVHRGESDPAWQAVGVSAPLGPGTGSCPGSCALGARSGTVRRRHEGGGVPLLLRTAAVPYARHRCRAWPWPPCSAGRVTVSSPGRPAVPVPPR